MVTQLERNWWAIALRGVAGVIFGVVAFFWPGLTLAALVLLFGAYALIDGAMTVAAAVFSAGHNERWGTMLLQGIAGMIAGLATFILPGITAIALVYIIAVWAVVTGIFEIAAAIRLRRQMRGEWILALSGVFSVILGVLLMLMPGAGAIALVWYVGAYALVFGVLLIALGFRLRRAGGGMRTRAAA